MKSSTILICFTLAVLLFSCESVSIRPVLEYTEVEVNTEGEILGSPVPDSEEDTEFTRAGIEVALTTEMGLELFADLNWAEADYDSTEGVDGTEVGIGARSLWPTEPGWGADWSGRISFFDLDDDEYNWFFGSIIDRDIQGYGITLKGGPYYAIEIADKYILSPHAGLFYNMKRGDEEVSVLGVKTADYDFDYDSFGAYVGSRFNLKSLKSIDIAADLFAGSSELVGFMLSAGIRF